jgi:ribosomal-protein-alanine N-acetyltransferase
MRTSDLSQVVQIEQQAFSSPWPQEVFCDCLKAGMSCWVLEHNGIVEAYGVMSIETTHAHILNVCVRPDAQRHGFGRRLLAHFIGVARAHHVKTVRLEVRPANTAALRLYTSMGFTEIGRRKAYYRVAQGHEDALVMARRV